jgi:phosphate transport system substrate-binding protein
MTVSIAGIAEARDQIRIVGSSTVFPFSTAVAETFGRTSSFKTPIVESTGSGGGLKLFCAGVGVEHPDITNASRRIKKAEFDKCQDNGVTDITEVKVGFDGIVLANAISGAAYDLSRKQIYLALAKQVPTSDSDCTLMANPNMKWSDIDASLPAEKIEVLGPPPTSGTRDAFEELGMQGGARDIACMADMRKADKKAFKKVASEIREDGGYIEAGENDNLIVNKLTANPAAIGIFGFSFLDQNEDKVKGAMVGGVEPTFEAIADGDYPISRSLFFYVKNAHVGVVPGIGEYVAEFTSEKAFGEDGYLADKGLIPLPEEDRSNVRSQATGFAKLSM